MESAEEKPWCVVRSGGERHHDLITRHLATTMPCLQATVTATREVGITTLSWGSEGQAPWLYVRMRSQVWGMYRHQGQPSHGAEW